MTRLLIHHEKASEFAYSLLCYAPHISGESTDVNGKLVTGIVLLFSPQTILAQKIEISRSNQQLGFVVVVHFPFHVPRCLSWSEN